MSKPSSCALGLALAAAALTTACGGGDDDEVVTVPPADATMVPASALASSSAFTQFVISLSASSSETAEPLSASNVDVPPGSETDEPVSVG